ncbi:MAG: hypothetical protein JWN93_3018 [Hyphomicrobiales bacterium]|nr:hypothetical protein [Hyphomicrobiales bacterium]
MDYRIAMAAALAGALASFAAPQSARAQALVVDGEEIADAALMAAAKKDGKIMHYGTWPPNAAAAVQAAFKKQTGLDVEYLRLTTQTMFPRVTAEFAAGKLQADLIDLTDLILVQELVEKGVLNTPHRVPSFDKLATELKDPEGRWYAFYRPPSAIVVNTALVKPQDIPKSFKDVLDPKWAGKVGMPSIDAGGSSFTLFMFLRDHVQDDYWRKLSALKPRVYPSIIPTVADVARGETALAIGGIDPAFQQIGAGAPLKIIFGAEGTPSFPISGGVPTGAKNAAAAKVYLNWLTSKAGGTEVGKAGSYGTHPEAAAPVALGEPLPPPGQIWNIQLADWVKKRESYSKEWRALFSGGK